MVTQVDTTKGIVSIRAVVLDDYLDDVHILVSNAPGVSVNVGNVTEFSAGV